VAVAAPMDRTAPDQTAPFYVAGRPETSDDVLIVRYPYDGSEVGRTSQARPSQVDRACDEASDVGPMINEDAARRVESWVDEAVAGGAKVLTGGVRDGASYAPTVLIDAPADAKVCTEEFVRAGARAVASRLG